MAVMNLAPSVPPAIGRHAERARTDRAALDAVLDAVPIATLATVAGGQPWVVPLLFARDGDRILLHGSTGAGALRHVAAGAPAALSVVVLDGIVVAHTLFDSSANYRSAVVRGHLVALHGEEQARALDRLGDRLIPGRTGEVEPSSAKDLAATMALALPITEWTVKVRTGGPAAPEGPGEAWCGVVPLRTVAGPVEPAPWVPDGAAPPPSVHRLLERVDGGGLR